VDECHSPGRRGVVLDRENLRGESSAPSRDEEMLNLFRRWPKVDLHRHLEGSLRFSTILELATSGRIDLPRETASLKSLVQVQPGDYRDPRTFLSKFDALLRVYRSPEIIQRVTRESIEDAAADGVCYLELRFTPVAMAHAMAFPLRDVIHWMTDATRNASEQTGVNVGLIASVNRHEPVDQAEEVARRACEFAGRGIVALDLAGDEGGFSAEPFIPTFREARRAGLGITVHAGEWGDGVSVRHALRDMDADRIAHGVRVLEDPEAVELALSRRTVFEVCLTSNLLSGVVDRLDNHPLIRMLEAGLQVTLNTDDPGICSTSMTQEMLAAVSSLGFSPESLKGLILAAVQGSFLPSAARRRLEREVQTVLWQDGESVA